ncbi:tail fiber assembly protein, partial [Salmonella enterica subsp. enterica serovar Montevideo]|nr:tail fiber assembly protein [Salmonella enterica subsp. enterica serovar Montevideo]ECX6309870.1 tail fiber assembly protein [Salmonella enterica subsp. enterica serovar Montevideo]
RAVKGNVAQMGKYRVLLMRVDTAKPVWPTPPGEQASQYPALYWYPHG